MNKKFAQLTTAVLKVAEKGFNLSPETPEITERVYRMQDTLAALLTPDPADSERIHSEILEISGAVAVQMVEREYPDTCTVIAENGDEVFTEEAQDAFTLHQAIIEGALYALVKMVEAKYEDRYIVNPPKL